ATGTPRPRRMNDFSFSIHVQEPFPFHNVAVGARPMQRVLIVEDERKLLASLQKGLSQEGYEVLAATTGEEGFYLATTQPLDAVILDWMLPRRDGVQVLRDLRAKGSALPVLMLTARDTIDDKVQGLDAGADDYLVKPFAFAEL